MPGREYWHDRRGYNYRLTNLCAAIGVAQLERLPQILARKRQIACWYQSLLPELTWLTEAPGETNSYWMCSLLLPDAAVRDRLRRQLAEAGIETSPLFFPVHTMPMYCQPLSSLPVTEDLSARGLNLPSYPQLSRQDVGEIAAALRSALS